MSWGRTGSPFTATTQHTTAPHLTARHITPPHYTTPHDTSYFMTTTEPRIIQATSAESAELRRAFIALQPGETMTDEQAARIIGMSWRVKPWVVDTARRQALAMEVVIARVRGHGFRRTDSTETSALAEDAIRRIRKSAKLHLRKQATVLPQDLAPDNRPVHYMRSAVLGLVAHSTSLKHQNVIRAQLTNSTLAIASAQQALKG